MNYRSDIERVFAGKAFLRPLFYSYPHGLRFELSEGGSAVEQFVTAMNKAQSICADIFEGQKSVLICLSVALADSRFSHREPLRALRAAGIRIPKQRSLWLEPDLAVAQANEDTPQCVVAFESPAPVNHGLLWTALAIDFGSIQPNPGCTVRLFNLDRGVMIFPYDDRGMDVVGPNQDFLTGLYHRHNHLLLDYDRTLMCKVFEPGAQSTTT